MNIEVLPKAKLDLIDGAKFYSEQSRELGKYFSNTILSDIKSLHIYYGIHIKVRNYHRLLSKRFPYAIYYKYDKDRIYIYAILDCGSNPMNINKRLS